MNSTRVRRKSFKRKPIQLPEHQNQNIEQIAKSNLFRFSNDELFTGSYDSYIERKSDPEPLSPIKILKEKLDTPLFSAKDTHLTRKNELDVKRYQSNKSVQLPKHNHLRIEELAKSTHQVTRIRRNSMDQKVSNSVCIIKKQKAINLSNYIVLGSVQEMVTHKNMTPKVEYKSLCQRKRISSNIKLLVKRSIHDAKFINLSNLLTKTQNQGQIVRPQSPQRVFDGRIIKRDVESQKRINYMINYCKVF